MGSGFWRKRQQRVKQLSLEERGNANRAARLSRHNGTLPGGKQFAHRSQMLRFDQRLVCNQERDPRCIFVAPSRSAAYPQRLKSPCRFPIARYARSSPVRRQLTRSAPGSRHDDNDNRLKAATSSLLNRVLQSVLPRYASSCFNSPMRVAAPAARIIAPVRPAFARRAPATSSVKRFRFSPDAFSSRFAGFRPPPSSPPALQARVSQSPPTCCCRPA